MLLILHNKQSSTIGSNNDNNDSNNTKCHHDPDIAEEAGNRHEGARVEEGGLAAKLAAKKRALHEAKKGPEQYDYEARMAALMDEEERQKEEKKQAKKRRKKEVAISKASRPTDAEIDGGGVEEGGM